MIVMISKSHTAQEAEADTPTAAEPEKTLITLSS